MIMMAAAEDNISSFQALRNENLLLMREEMERLGIEEAKKAIEDEIASCATASVGGTPAKKKSAKRSHSTGYHCSTPPCGFSEPTRRSLRVSGRTPVNYGEVSDDAERAAERAYRAQQRRSNLSFDVIGPIKPTLPPVNWEGWDEPFEGFTHDEVQEQMRYLLSLSHFAWQQGAITQEEYSSTLAKVTKLMPKRSGVLQPSEVTPRMLNAVHDRSTSKLYDKNYGTSCHQCRQKTLDTKTVCRNPLCGGPATGQFCGYCLLHHYGERVEDALLDPGWHCLKCRGICHCSICRNRHGLEPLGCIVNQIPAHYTNVHEYLVNENIPYELTGRAREAAEGTTTTTSRAMKRLSTQDAPEEESQPKPRHSKGKMPVIQLGGAKRAKVVTEENEEVLTDQEEDFEDQELFSEEEEEGAKAESGGGESDKDSDVSSKENKTPAPEAQEETEQKEKV